MNARSVITETSSLTPVAAPLPIMTKAEAIAICTKAGTSYAGIDGSLVRAFKAFKNDKETLDEMVKVLSIAYLTKKLDVSKDEAKLILGKSRPPKDASKADDSHRTLEQERVLVSVRVLVSRAKEMAGFEKDKAKSRGAKAKKAKDKAAKGAIATANADIDPKEQARLIKADSIVNPADDVDAFDAMSRVVLTLKSMERKYTKKLVGERGDAWRAWLAASPK